MERDVMVLARAGLCAVFAAGFAVAVGLWAKAKRESAAEAGEAR